MLNDPVQKYIIEQNTIRVKKAILGKKKLKRPDIPRFPLAIEKKYIAQLRNIFLAGEKLYNKAISDSSIIKEILRIDEDSDEINAVFLALKKNWLSVAGDVKLMAHDIGQKVSEWNDNNWRIIMKKVIGIDIFTHQKWLPGAITSFSSENAGLIITLQEKTVEDLRGIVQRAYRDGGRVEKLTTKLTRLIQAPGAYKTDPIIKEIVRKRWKKAKNHAELLARDQVSKLNGQLTKRRQQDLGLNKYEWSTSRDARVRKTHHAMDRRICDWNDPTTYYIGDKAMSRALIGGVNLHPGYDYQCRCVGLPYFEDFQEFEKEEK